MKTFSIGTRVTLVPWMNGVRVPATVSSGIDQDGDYEVRFDDNNDNEAQGTWYIFGHDDYGIEAVEKTPAPKVFSPTSQNGKLLSQMQAGRSVTRVTAFSYGVMNLTARIADLRNGGYDVQCDNRVDHDGSRYGSFRIAA